MVNDLNTVIKEGTVLNDWLKRVIMNVCKVRKMHMNLAICAEIIKPSC